MNAFSHIGHAVGPQLAHAVELRGATPHCLRKYFQSPALETKAKSTALCASALYLFAERELRRIGKLVLDLDYVSGRSSRTRKSGIFLIDSGRRSTSNPRLRKKAATSSSVSIPAAIGTVLQKLLVVMWVKRT